MRTFPFDLGVIDAQPDWRRDFAWPLDQEQTLKVCGDVTSRLALAIRDIPDDETARIAEAAVNRVRNFILPAVHAAGVLSAAARTGMTLLARDTALQRKLRFPAGTVKPGSPARGDKMAYIVLGGATTWRTKKTRSRCSLSGICDKVGRCRSSSSR